MAEFTVRVELFGNASEDDYENLHKKMQAKKYFRLIQGGSGKWYHLPTATYDRTADSSASTIRDEVSAIAKALWNNPGVLVTESDGRSWQGLKTATPAEVKELTSSLTKR